MQKLIQLFDLPLVRRELVEAAHSRRTYIMRTIFAGVVALLTLVQYASISSNRSTTIYSMLGTGQWIYQMLIALSMFGIILFLPGLVCNSITIEKERQTFSLLLLTKLSQVTILLEKYLSRLIPMMLLLLSIFPLLAFGYSMGGITIVMMINGVQILLGMMLAITSIGLFCSAYFRKTTTAFLNTYFLVFGISLFVPLLIELCKEVFQLDSMIDGYFQSLAFYLGLGGLTSGEDIFWLLMPPYAFFMYQSIAPVQFFFITLLYLLVTLVFFGLARWVMVKRAFAPETERLMKTFNSLDKTFEKANKKFTGGVQLTRKSVSLPEDRPISWRETTKRSLGTTRYLVRMLLIIQTPILVFITLALATAIDNNGRGFAEITMLISFIIWFVAALLVCVTSVNLIAKERSKDTLEVMLTTPLSSYAILQEKMGSIWRLIIVLLIPMYSLVAFRQFIYGFENDFDENLSYALGSYGLPLVLLSTIAWISCFCGLKIKKQVRALPTAIGIIVAWCIVPLVVVVCGMMFLDAMDIVGNRTDDHMGWFLAVSPLIPIGFNEFGDWDDIFSDMDSGVLPLTYCLLMYAFIGLLIRHHILSNASKLLGRAEPPRG